MNTTQQVTMGREDGLRTDQERDHKRARAMDFKYAVLRFKGAQLPRDILTRYLPEFELIEAVLNGRRDLADEIAANLLRAAADDFGDEETDRSYLRGEFK